MAMILGQIFSNNYARLQIDKHYVRILRNLQVSRISIQDGNKSVTYLERFQVRFTQMIHTFNPLAVITNNLEKGKSPQVN